MLKILLPTSVEDLFVIPVVEVLKRKEVAQNAPVVMLVKQVLVMVVLVKHVLLVNLVHPMIRRLRLVHLAIKDIIKKNLVKVPVYHAYQERMKIKLDPLHVNNVYLVNTKALQ